MRALLVASLVLGGCGLFKPVVVADASSDRADVMADGALDSMDTATDAPVMDTIDVVAEDTQVVDTPPEACTPPANDTIASAMTIFTADLPPGGAATCVADAGVDAGTDAGADAASDVMDAADVVLDGALDAITSDAPDADAGDGGVPLPLATYTIHGASTVCADHTIDVPCDSTHGGADVFYRFTLTLKEVVYADTFPASGSPSFRTILFFVDSTGHVLNRTSERDCDVNAACPSVQGSQIAAVLDPGTYYLGLSGVGSDTGTTDIHMRFLPVDRGMVTPLPSGTQMISGTVASDPAGGDFPVCGLTAHGVGNTYWWATCPDAPAGRFHADVCGQFLVFFAGLALRSADLGDFCGVSNSACALTGQTLDTTISAGTGLYAFYVGGPGCNAGGNYTLNVMRP